MNKKIWIIGLGLFLCSCRGGIPTRVYQCEKSAIQREYQFDFISKLDVYSLYCEVEGGTLGEIRLHEGGAQKVVITANEDLFDQLTCTKDKDTIKIKGSSRYRYKVTDMTIDIYGYTFSEIDVSSLIFSQEGNPYTSQLDFELSGAGIATIDANALVDLDVDVSGASTLNLSNYSSSELDATISGSSSLIAKDIATQEMDLDISGASYSSFTGTTRQLDIDVSGASKFEGKELEIQNAEVEISGASQAKMYCTQLIHGNVSGASSLVVYGNPTVNVSSSGASEVRRES